MAIQTGLHLIIQATPSKEKIFPDLLYDSHAVAFLKMRGERNSRLGGVSERKAVGIESVSASFRKCCDTFFPGNGALSQGLTPLWRSITFLLVA